MLRQLARVTGLLVLISGLLLTAAPAFAEDPPEPPLVLTLATQRIELLPQGPLCWNVYRFTYPAGQRVPASDFLTVPLSVSYVEQGEFRGEYKDGPTRVVRTGEAGIVGANNWFSVQNIGRTTGSYISFALTCGMYPPAGVPGVTHLGTTPQLGITPGAQPYMVTTRTGRSSAGSQGPVVSHSGPVVYYILEGDTAISKQDGVTRYRTGDFFAIPANTPYQYSNIGTGTNRSLYVFLTPADAALTQLHPDVRLPQFTPAALPRTGESVPQAAGLALTAVGAALLAVGRRLGRTA